jgi:hypothetical protein
MTEHDHHPGIKDSEGLPLHGAFASHHHSIMQEAHLEYHRELNNGGWPNPQQYKTHMRRAWHHSVSKWNYENEHMPVKPKRLLPGLGGPRGDIPDFVR